MTLLLQTLLGAVTLGMGLGDFENGILWPSTLCVLVGLGLLISSGIEFLKWLV